MASGRLIYLIGPSGAGKDTLLWEASRRLSHRGNVRFPRRVITRPRDQRGDDVRELYEWADEARFRSREMHGDFLVTWRSHGLAYGLPGSIREDLADRRDVVVNGSRGALDRARAAVERIQPVYIWADANTLAQRLRQRGREDEADIEHRIARGSAYAIPQDAAVIDNSGSLDDAIGALCRILGPTCDDATANGRFA